MTQPEQKTLILRMIIAAFVVVLALLAYLLFFSRAKVEIEVSPDSSVVTLDNRPAQLSDGKAKFYAILGDHTLKVEADDYVGYKEEIELKRGSNYSKKITLQKAPSPIEIGANVQYIAIKDNEVYYQDGGDKLFYKIKIAFDAGGQPQVEAKQAITSEPIAVVDAMIWSPTKELVALKRGAVVSMLDFKKYDFVGQNETVFGADIGDIVWSPDNSRLAYYYAPSLGERSIIFADKTNSVMTRAANLKELGIENPFLVFSPNSKWLAIIPRNKNYDQNKIYLMNVYSKEIKTLIDNGNQKELTFSLDSQKIIYSTFSANQQNSVQRELYVAKIDGSEKKKLAVSAKATDSLFWSDTDKIFLHQSLDGCKLKLLDFSSLEVIDFYFKGQNDSNISEILLNDQKSGAIFVAKGKLYFVKLTSN